VTFLTGRKSVFSNGDRHNITHSYIREANGVFTTIDAPGASETDAYDINDLGQIVGYEYSTLTGWRGFIATPVPPSPTEPVPEPGGLALLGIGMLGLGMIRRCVS
jgi:hypothetical protein